MGGMTINQLLTININNRRNGFSGLISNHGITVTGGVFNIRNDGVQLSNGFSVYAGGFRVFAGMTASAGILITGGYSIKDSGLKVSSGSGTVYLACLMVGQSVEVTVSLL